MNRHSHFNTVLVAYTEEKTDREDMLDIIRCRDSVLSALDALDYQANPFPVKPDDLVDMPSLASRLFEASPLCVFNLFEGFSFDSLAEVRFCSLLEMMDIPFTGNGSYTLGKCLNKAHTKAILIDHGIPVPRGWVALPGKIPSFNGVRGPFFIKPCQEDGSVGIDATSMVKDEDLKEMVSRKLMEHPRGIIVEEFLPGQEFNVGILGNDPYEIQSVSMLDYSRWPHRNPFLGYSSKWDPSDGDFHMKFVDLDGDFPVLIRARIMDTALKAGRALGCSGYFRVDLRERNGEIYVLEVNPNPDINVDSGLARQCGTRGLSYPGMVESIIRYGLSAFEEKSIHARNSLERVY